MGKLDEIELERRYRFFEDLIAAQVPRHQIYSAAMEQFEISRRTCQRIMGEVRRRWIEESRDEEREEQREAVIRTFQVVIQGAIADRRWSAATRATRELAKMLGVHVGELVRHEGKIDHKHHQVPVSELTPAEKRVERARLAAKRAAYEEAKRRASGS